MAGTNLSFGHAPANGRRTSKHAPGGEPANYNRDARHLRSSVRDGWADGVGHNFCLGGFMSNYYKSLYIKTGHCHEQ